MNGCCRLSLEFPAGLLDPGEQLHQTAERELVEETGFSGKIKSVSPVVYSDPWKSNENTTICLGNSTLTLRYNSNNQKVW